MQVQDIMVRDAKSCRMDTNLAAATAIMWNNGCGALPVVEDTGKVVGMITDRDICIAVGTRNRLASEIKIAEVIPQKAFTCAPEDDIRAALRTMQTEKVRRLAVVSNDGLLKGILCLDDIILNARKTAALSYGHLFETVRALCERPVPHRIRAA
jgi:CBS domain-containing protein